MGNVIGGETIAARQSIVLGIAKVISQEYSNFNCHVLDLANSTIELNSLSNYIITECLTPSQHLLRAYRHNYPWNLSYQPYQIENQQSLLKQQGVYLIIGSITGSLGLVWAKYLVENFQAKIVLIGNNIQLENISDTEYFTIEANICDEAAVSNAISEAEKHFDRTERNFSNRTTNE